MEKYQILPKCILLERDKNRVDHVKNVLKQSFDFSLFELPNGQLYLNEQHPDKKVNVGQFEIIKACDASVNGLCDSLLNQYGIKLYKSFKPGQIGCFFSHFLLWKELAEKKEIANTTDKTTTCFLIFEDDAEIVDISTFWMNLSQCITEIEQDSTRNKDAPWRFLYLYFNCYKPEPGTDDYNAKYNIGDNCLITRSFFTYGLVGYIITQEGAKFLVDHFEKNGLHNPVDDEIGHVVHHFIKNNTCNSGFYTIKNHLITTVGQLYPQYDGEKLKSNIW